ncbi:hypothetical protein F5Y13DRAFT_190632 [Hypoxylon sp. FL1857]|nr:hypothetical protein F5Y13DRAFT_190632 [Hypoxylon sp. FL1857]
MASLQGASFSQLPLYHWDPVFDSPRGTSGQHNKPYIDVVDDADIDLDPIKRFAKALEETDSCHYATDTLAKFCTGVNLQTLQQNPSVASQLVAILEDSGGLTAWGLHQALSNINTENQNSDVTDVQQTGQNKAVKSHVRRLYATNLNCWTVFALAATAPTHQARVLGEFILKHLRFDPLVYTKIPFVKLPIFALEFHLPYLAWRKHMLPRADSQRTINGKGLRHYQDITFLRTMSKKADNSLTEYLYQANISCLVSGLDSYSWTAYFFNDTYFEADDCPENIQEYDAQECPEHMLDPLTAGKRPRHLRPSCPREYFLIISETHIRRAKEEWQQSFYAVDDAIQSYKSEYWTQARKIDSCNRDDPKACSTSDRERCKLREDFQEWMRQCAELLRKIINSLGQYAKERRIFLETGINSFVSSDPLQSTRLSRVLTAIDQHFVELERLSSNVQNVMDSLCQDTHRDVNLRLSHESNESALFQQKTARDVKVLTWMTFLSLPFALAAGLLSTQEGFIPIRPSPWALLASIAILEILVWLILGSLLGWNWFWENMKWARHQLGTRERDIEGVELQ